jgi:hypothetical protein
MEIRCVLHFPGKVPPEECILAWVPRVGDIVVAKRNEMSHLMVKQVRHVARGAISDRPEAHVELDVSYVRRV